MQTGDGPSHARATWTTIRQADEDEIARVIRFLVSCGIPDHALRVKSGSDHGADQRHGLLSRFARTHAADRQHHLLVLASYAPAAADLLRPFEARR